MNIFLYLGELAQHFGPGEQLTGLARELERRGHHVVVFVEQVVEPNNQYLMALQAAGVPAITPGPCAAWVERWSWLNRLLLVLLIPLRLPLTLLDIGWHHRSFTRSWRGVRGRINRYLPAVQLFRPLHWILLANMTRQHQRLPADLVHTFSGTGSVFEWATHHDVPIIYNENIVPSDQFGVDWWADMKRYADKVDLTISVCAAAEPNIRSFLGYQGPVTVVPCMLGDPMANNALSQLSRINQDTKLILGSAARLTAAKGHSVLLRAIPLVLEHRREPPLELWLAGDGPERDSLKVLAQQLGISAHVRFLGHCGPREMAAFWREIDIFVLPSLWEGLPNVILEAMTHGKPVIATDVGGVTEAVLDCETGLVVPPNKVESLALAIMRLMQDAQERERMGRAGQARCRMCYRPDVVVEQYLTAYEAVVSHGR